MNSGNERANRMIRKPFFLRRAAQGSPCGFICIFLLLDPLQGVPAPIATTSFAPIDLSRYSTTRRAEFRPWVNWNGPPGGVQKLGGVPFQIDGVMQFRTFSPRLPFDGYPTRIRNIQVGRRLTQLHLLHFSEFSGTDGQPAARLVLHYADSKEHEFILRYGIHFQDWVHPLEGQVCSDPLTRTAWFAPPRSEPDNPLLTTLWHTELDNPRPDADVLSIEVRSLFSQVRYSLAAITTESGRPTQRQKDLRPMRTVNEPVIVRFRLLDADTGAPITNACVQASGPREGELLQRDPFETDAQGVVAIDFPNGATVPPLEFLATGHSHVSTRFSLTTNPQSMPDFKMHRGKPIGGRVVDEAGGPVAGATITIGAPYNDDSGKFSVAKWPPALTDTNGLWSLACAPSEVNRFIINIQHSPLLPGIIFEQDDDSHGPFSFRGKELSQRKATFTIKAGASLKASVTCSGKPVTAAQATVFLWESPIATRLNTRTDTEGRFMFSGLPNGPIWLLVTADGFSPDLQKLEPTTNSISILLPPGRSLQAIVQDESGRPVPNALFQVTSWRGDSWLQQFGYADAEGKYRWDSAPEGRVTFNLSCPRFHGFQGLELTSGTPARILKMQRD